MQRDAYAALVKKKNKKKIPLRILQMSGDIFKEWIFDEVFIGYRNRRLVLVTHMAGTDPRCGPRLAQDILIPDFAKLQKIHQPHFVYKLIPMMCSNIESFALMQAVCHSPGSPFVIEDRWDTHGLTMRFAIVSAHRELVKSELLQCRLLSAAQMANIRLGNFPITGVEFDAALVKRGRVSLPNTASTTSSNNNCRSTAASSSDIPTDSGVGDGGGSMTTVPSSFLKRGADRGGSTRSMSPLSAALHATRVLKDNNGDVGSGKLSPLTTKPTTLTSSVLTNKQTSNNLSSTSTGGSASSALSSKTGRTSTTTTGSFSASNGVSDNDNGGGGTGVEGTSTTPSSPSTLIGFISSAALCTRVDYLTDADLNKRIIMDHFFRSPTYWKLGSNSQLFQLVRETRERIHILGVSNPIAQGRTDLLMRARENGIHVYEKVGDYLYAYAKP